jgi:hypothetical protein
VGVAEGGEGCEGDQDGEDSKLGGAVCSFSESRRGRW